MTEKILIAYATRAGSTREIAFEIGRVLAEQGKTVDVLCIKEVRSLNDYSGVILGSGIRVGGWMPEAVKFVETHQAELHQMPTAFFLVSLFLHENTPEVRATVAAYLDPVRKIFEPAAIGLFAGKMDFKALTWPERQIAKMVKSPEGDFRDWPQIRSWAADLQQTIFSPVLS